MSLTYGDIEGKDATVLLLGPGDLIGAMEGSEDLDYSQNIVALKSTVLCRMTRLRMESLLNRYPELGYRITKFSGAPAPVCSSAGRDHDQASESAPGHPAHQSGRRVRPGHRRRVPQCRPDRHPRRPRPSVGSSREMASKVMGGYREKGLIRSSRRQIEVVDRDELRKITASGC